MNPAHFRDHLATVSVKFPPWGEFEQFLQDELQTVEGEPTDALEVPVMIKLPGVLWLDLDSLSTTLGWTLGQVITYLVVQATAYLTQDPL